MRNHPAESNVDRDMHEPSFSLMALSIDRRQIDLERARRRRDQAAQGSPDWDAASEAVLELEAHASLRLADQLRRRVFVAERQAAG